MKLIQLLIGLILLLIGGAGYAEKPLARIAIIIDDMGYYEIAGRKAIDLPGPVTYAFLPHTRYSQEQAELAYQLGKEIMLHLPMESAKGNRLGPGALTLEMNKAELISTFRSALDSVPHVVGVNNHMGSLLTQDPTSMRWLMTEMRQLDLFFIDSRTTHHTVAEKVALRNGLHSAQRDVFLDHNPQPAAIKSQFDILVGKALALGSAIGIGHPYRPTLQVLAEMLPELANKGIELVPVSEITNERSILWHASSSHLLKAAKNSKPSP